MRAGVVGLVAMIARALVVAATASYHYDNGTEIPDAQASPSCAINTIFVPITVTETVTASSNDAWAHGTTAAGISPTYGDSNDPTTLTSTSTHTSVVTVLYASTSVPSDGSSAVKYYYFMTDGTTSWINGRSPSGYDLATETTTLTTFPSAYAGQSTKVTMAGLTALTKTETVVPPAYTTTLYSIVPASAGGADDPDITRTTRITTWSTTTETIVVTRTSLNGLGSNGWNSSFSIPYPSSTVWQDPTATTSAVQSVALSEDGRITRTSTSLVTTTLTEWMTVLDTHSLSNSAKASSSAAVTYDNGTATSGRGSSDMLSLVTISGTSRLFSYPPTPSPGSYATLGTSYSPVRGGAGKPRSNSTIAASSPSNTVNALDPSETGTGVAASWTSASHRIITATITGTPETVNPPIDSTRSAPRASPVQDTSSLAADTSNISSPSIRETTLQSISAPSHGNNITAASAPIIAGTPSDTYSGSGPLSFGVTSSFMRTTTDSIASSQGTYSLNATSTFVHHSGPNSILSPSSSSSWLNVNKSSTSTSMSFTSSLSLGPSPTPSVCGEHGNFTMSFDDLPNFAPGKNDSDVTQRPPVTVFRPYNHFSFSNGYVYAPLPVEPYQPVSRPNVGVFLANGTNKLSHNPPGILPGEFGTVDGQDAISAFWFDAWSAFFGCDNAGRSECVLVMSAYRFNRATQDEMRAEIYYTTVPACIGGTTACQLRHVAFPDTFRNLTGLQIDAYVNGQQSMWFVDNVALGWSDNSCAAGLRRQSSP